MVQSGCCCRYCSVLREMKLRTYASLSHLMPVPVCLFVATFDPTVERAQNGEERRMEFVRRSLHHHGRVACASSRFIVSCRARTSKRPASRPRMWAYRAAWVRSRCSKRAAQAQRFGPNATSIRRSPRPWALGSTLFFRGSDGVLAWSWRVDGALDIGSFQYFSGNEKGLASLQGLDFPSLFGSPTWARTRDLRINRLPLDLPANPHECSLSGVGASNISRPFHLRKAWEGVI